MESAILNDSKSVLLILETKDCVTLCYPPPILTTPIFCFLLSRSRIFCSYSWHFSPISWKTAPLPRSSDTLPSSQLCNYLHDSIPIYSLLLFTYFDFTWCRIISLHSRFQYLFSSFPGSIIFSLFYTVIHPKNNRSSHHSVYFCRHSYEVRVMLYTYPTFLILVSNFFDILNISPTLPSLLSYTLQSSSTVLFLT